MVKKLVDTWKTKQWYDIYPPKFLGTKSVGETAASDPKILQDRIIKVGLDELTNDMSQVYTSVKLRIVEVAGNKVYTKFIGFELLPSMVKTFIKRRNSLIDDVIKVRTSDGHDIILKMIVFASGRIARGAEAQIRTTLRKEVIAVTSKFTLEQLLQELLFKRFSNRFIPVLKKIAPIRRIILRKTQVIESFAKD